MPDILQSIILGAIQGITEWLPISSKSQVVLAATAIGISPDEALSYALFMHIGTLLAAIFYFRNEFISALKGSKAGERNFVIIGTLCTAITGLPLFLLLRKSFDFSQGLLITALIGIGLLITGILLLKIRASGSRNEGAAQPKDAALVGLAQGFSVLPGISRSGTTTAALLARGFSQDSALRLSFMLSIPTVAAAEVGFSIIEGFPPLDLSVAVAMVGSAFIFGILSISTLVGIARRINFGTFCLALGILAIIPYALKLLGVSAI